MNFGSGKFSQLKSFITCALILAVFYIISRSDYLLFHSFSDGFSIAIACGIFMISWNSREFIENNYIVFLGTAYLFIGVTDFLHMLAYPGMGVFADDGGNLYAGLWISARYLESLSLIAAPFFINRKVNAMLIFFVFLTIITLLLSSIFYLKILPCCYIGGVGLTGFKKVNEYIICIIFAAAAYHLYLKRHSFDWHVFQILTASICISVIAELFFTFYIDVRDQYNFPGHMFKIVSYYLIYKAIIDIGLKNPYHLMFREIVDEKRRYRQIFENIQAVKLIINPENGAIVEANNSAVDFYGYPREELTAMKISDIDTLPEKSIASVLKNKRLRDKPFLTFSHRLASGEIRQVEAYSGPIKLGDDILLHVIIHDVTERRLAEEGLFKNQKILSDTLESISDGFFSLDNQMTVTYFNAAAERLLGEGTSDLVGRDLLEAVPGISGTVFEEKFRYCINEKERVAFQAWFGVEPYKNLYDVRGYPFEDGISVYFQVITERKQLEIRLQQAQKMEAIGTLSGGIAHDFNNILSSIIGYAEVAIDEVEKGSDLEDDLKEILTAGIRAKDLVDQIKSFSRQDDEEIIPVCVGGIVKEAVKFIRASIPSTIDIRINIDSKNTVILGTPSQVYQIFMNLFTNAAHAMGDSGVLDVSLMNTRIDRVDEANYPNLESGDYLQIKIADTGTGIHECDFLQIFEPCFTSKEHDEGTGLGLSIVNGIVNSYGGIITVDSDVGKGTTFTILLPVVEHQAQSIDVDRVALNQGFGKILLVDDELPIVKLMKKILSNAGYQVTAHTDSPEALRMFKAAPDEFDLVISDVTMPDLTGDELVKAMMAIRPDIPVILCTGYSRRLPPDPVKDFKVSALLKKPIIKSDLIEAVREALGEGLGDDQ